MSLFEMPGRGCANHGVQRGALKAGEARTLAGMIAGVGPEPAEEFILITVLKCPACGEPHRLALDKSVDTEVALYFLNEATGLMVMHRIREGMKEEEEDE